VPLRVGVGVAVGVGRMIGASVATMATATPSCMTAAVGVGGGGGGVGRGVSRLAGLSDTGVGGAVGASGTWTQAAASQTSSSRGKKGKERRKAGAHIIRAKRHASKDSLWGLYGSDYGWRDILAPTAGA
jgi:hypothetical protein